MPSRRGLLAAPLLAAARPARAQAPWPARPIRMIIPWPPGQATDLIGRVLAVRLTEALGQPVVPENRAGAGGTIGTDAAAKAAPDGYTLLAASSGPVTISGLLQRLPFDAERDLVPIALISISPYIVAVHPSVPATDMASFIAEVRSKPGRYTFSSSGTGATAHLIGEWFNRRLGLDVLHVPFSGSAPAVTAVVGGQVHYTLETVAAVQGAVRDGRLRAFGISLERGSALTPDVPTIAAVANLPGFDAGAWVGVMAPAGTPAPIVERVSAEVLRALEHPEMRQQLVSIGVERDARGAASFAEYIRQQRAVFKAIIDGAGIKLD